MSWFQTLLPARSYGPPLCKPRQSPAKRATCTQLKAGVAGAPEAVREILEAVANDDIDQDFEIGLCDRAGRDDTDADRWRRLGEGRSRQVSERRQGERAVVAADTHGVGADRRWI